MHDVVIRNGLVASDSGPIRCDVAVAHGRIVALGENIPNGERVIDATGLLVLPGGVDSHCHIEEPAADGSCSEESFISASTRAHAASISKPCASGSGGKQERTSKPACWMHANCAGFLSRPKPGPMTSTRFCLRPRQAGSCDGR